MKIDERGVQARPRAPTGQTSPTGQTRGTAPRFRHEALFYNGVNDFVGTATPFIRDGIDAGEPVLVVVGREKIGLLREALGDDADRVDFRDMDSVGANPARIIAAWYDFVAECASEGRHIRGIGEPISNDRSPAALVECQRHESLLNLAFHDASAWWLLCPYDTSVLNDSVIEEALRSHPWIQEGATHRASDIFLDIDEISRPFDAPLPEPHVRPWEMVFALDDLADLRSAVARIASEHGFDRSGTEDLVVAVNEVAINSLRHGGGDGVLRIWREGDMLTCEIRDRGRIEQPLVGRRRPKAGQEGGFGVWLVHQLCDLVQMRQFPNGSVVRMHMSIPRNEV
jgi:anti-sigma regulatory factor (Ser/Thr protein kinase)